MHLILGNGTTRDRFDIKKFQDNPKWVIWGCNAIYRDYAPDYVLPHFLVAIDDGMIKEIQESNFPQHRFILPPEDERWEPAACNPHRPRSNAGFNAIIEAIKRGATKIVCAGFDFLIQGSESMSNLYDGTPNYGPETRANAQDNPGRVRFLRYLLNKHPNVNFVFAYPYLSTQIGFNEPNMWYVNYRLL